MKFKFRIQHEISDYVYFFHRSRQVRNKVLCMFKLMCFVYRTNIFNVNRQLLKTLRRCFVYTYSKSVCYLISEVLYPGTECRIYGKRRYTSMYSGVEEEHSPEIYS